MLEKGVLMLYNYKRKITKDGKDMSTFHLVDHPLIQHKTTILRQKQTPNKEFRENIGFYPVIFTYPFGSVSHESLPVIRECGFLMTLTCREQMNYITREPDCLYGIGRYNRSGLYSTEEYMARLFNA